MGQVYYYQLVEGIMIPAIIHNGGYHLTQISVYENGTIDCWGMLDLKQFYDKLMNGWVVTQVPIDTKLSIFSLGSFPICEAHWKYTPEKYYQYIKKILHSLNPKMDNQYHVTPRIRKKMDESRRSWFGTGSTPYKVKQGFGYDLLDGKSEYIFYRKKGKLYLTPFTVYEDKTLRFDITGEKNYTMDDIISFFEQDILCTTLKNEEWVYIKGLGKMLLAPPVYGELSNQQKLQEINDMIAKVSKEQDSLARCKEAYYQYLVDPNDWTREFLRKAYEAVPEHQRMYLGSMDDKDSDIIRILNYPNSKREV